MIDVLTKFSEQNTNCVPTENEARLYVDVEDTLARAVHVVPELQTHVADIVQFRCKHPAMRVTVAYKVDTGRDSLIVS